jgi:hypothetical protein
MRRTKSRWSATPLKSAPLPEGAGAKWIRFDDVPERWAGSVPVPSFITGVSVGLKPIGGIWGCVGVCITSDGELTSERYRSLALGVLINEAREAARLVHGKPPRIALRPQPGARGPDFEFYREIADAYRFACQQSRRKPVKWLADQHGLGLETMARYVRKARTLGFLRPAINGKPGEEDVQPKRRKKA